MPRFLPVRCITFLVATTTLLLACARSAPMSIDERESANADGVPAIRVDDARPWSVFYPLALGNKWRYANTYTVQFIVDGQPPEPPETTEEIHEFEQICHEMIGGREYVVQRRAWYDGEGRSGVQHIRYRQDVTGLYEADICLCEPPECVDGFQEPIDATDSAPSNRYERIWEKIALRLPEGAARERARSSWNTLSAKLEALDQMSRTVRSEGRSPMVSELTRLKYPLFPGQSWAIRNGGGGFVFKAGVEAFEVVATPVGKVPAYRVRVTPPIDPAPDEVLTFVQWWGQCGFIGSKTHYELRYFDPDGDSIFVIGDEVQEITEINLVDLRPCTIAQQ